MSFFADILPFVSSAAGGAGAMKLVDVLLNRKKAKAELVSTGLDNVGKAAEIWEDLVDQLKARAEMLMAQNDVLQQQNELLQKRLDIQRKKIEVLLGKIEDLTSELNASRNKEN